MTTLGLITVGQSPRTDLIPDFAAGLPGVDLLEAGALDGLSAGEIAALAPKPGEYPIACKLASGEAVAVAKANLLPRIQRCITDLESRGAHLIVLMCAGTFPAFQHRVPLVLPGPVVGGVVQGLASTARRIGVLVPLAEQVAPAEQELARPGLEVLGRHAGPYSGVDRVRAAARELAAARCDFIYGKCFGFNSQWKQVIREASGLPVVSPVSLLVCTVADLIR